jgi:hypothetical protein
MDCLPMRCFRCGGSLIETRVRRGNGMDLVDPAGPTIKTKCSACGVLFGYRPFLEVQNDGSAVRRKLR